MLNFNGNLISPQNKTITSENRGFKYGDAIFETIKVFNNNVIFWEDHYFRLMASMRMLRMKIPMNFTLEFLEQEILKTVKTKENNTFYRVRLHVFRQDGGLYVPKTNEINYLIDVKKNTYQRKKKYSVDIYKDFYNYSGILSTIKTTNKLLNTLSGIYAEENNLDNCILLNEKKTVVEATNGNIFIVKDGHIKTPALTEGCVKGIIRKKIIEILEETPELSIEQTTISAFDIQKSEELFITNTIIGIQSVTKYRKKNFKTTIADNLRNKLKIKELQLN